MALRHGLATGDVFIRRDEYRTSTGVKVVHAQQYHRGLKVFRSSQVLKIDKGVVRKTPPLFRIPADLAVKPEVGPLDAVSAAIAFLQKRNLVAATLRVSLIREIRLGHLVDAPAIVELRYGLASPARLHLEIFPQPAGRAALVWVGDLALKTGRRFHVAVSAQAARPRVLFAAQTNTCAFSADWVPFPGVAEHRTFPIPPLTTSTGTAGVASQWQDGALAGGPNVSCHVGDADKVDPLGTLPVDNAFVWCNLMHDFFWELGFDSAHHAFEGKDPLRVERLKQKSARGAEFDNERDGWRPKMVLYSSPAGAARHAANDPSILIHEYTHGVSSRLVGGDECQYPFVEAQAWGFSEGMSDYFALSVLNFLDRARGGPGSLAMFGGTFRPGGLRDYSTFTGGWTPHQSDPYRIGMAWCGALLDSRAAILAITGDQDLTDRFVWQACMNTFKTMAPLCKQSLSLSLVHAKGALVDEVSALEGPWAIVGAAAAMAQAFTGRGI
ncbi:MAG: M36 family metallopeptidase [bacterium]